MPKVYRAMREQDGLPIVSSTAEGLGVRVGDDIRADETGQVQPGTGGMSVAPSLRDLPAHRIPKRLRPLVPLAAGKDALAVWSMGAGPFETGSLAAGLNLRVDPKNAQHGFVEPEQRTPLDAYQEALAITRGQWQKDEAG